MPGFVEVVIDSIRVSLMSPQRVVVLRQVGGERFLPIWVGPYEAEAITVALQEIEMARPLTHDLLKNLFDTFNARIRQVEIVSLREDIFYGNIVAEINGQTLSIDSRPSDAIALAVRAHVPIFVAEEVMDSAGTTPEKDIQSEAPAGSDAPAVPLPPAEPGQDRLSIFEDFLEKLDREKKDDDQPDASDQPDEPKEP